MALPAPVRLVGGSAYVTPDPTAGYRVAEVAGVDLTSAGEVALFEVPAGYRFLTLHASLQLTAVAAYAGPPEVDLKEAGGSDGEIIPTETLTGLSVVDQLWQLVCSGLSRSVGPEGVVALNVGVAADADELQVTVHLFGVLVPA